MTKFKKENVEDFKVRAETFLQAIGVQKFKYSSDYVSDSRGKSDVKKQFCPRRISVQPYNKFITTWKGTKKAAEYENDVCYIPITGTSPEITDKLKAYLLYLHFYGQEQGKTIEVLGIPKTYSTIPETLSNYHNLYDYVDGIHKKTPLSAFDTNLKFGQVYKSMHTYSRFTKQAERVIMPSDIIDYYNTLHVFFDNTSSSDTLMNDPILTNFFDIKIKSPKLKVTEEELLSKYSLFLKLISISPSSGLTNKDLEEYLALVKD